MAMSLAIFFRFVFVLALAFTVLDVGAAPLVCSVDGSG
jgi:fucose permease